MRYRCQNCGYQSLKWLGRCPTCGQWESFLEHQETPQTFISAAKPQALAEIELDAGGRWPTGIGEFDRILGGGVIAGSLILIGGEPGVGKSTIMLEVAGRLARSVKNPVIYVSGEEAPAQIKLRAERLGLGSEKNLLILSEQNLLAIAQAVTDAKASAVVIDSIQVVFPPFSKEGIGTTQQVGEATFELSKLAKSQKIPIFLIGHITKGGELAGPKAIEHMVDVVLYLEGGRESDIRILRSVKNRYGSTDEIGVFQMKKRGLVEITNPSEFFTARGAIAKPGSVIVPSLEGTRPILIEIQALVSSARYSSGYPQRRATGLDYNRIALLLAVIEKRLGLHIGGEDVYLNVAGGLTIRETATDLGVTAAVVSSFKNRAIARDTVVVGEVSLSGEVRRVRKLKERLSEAAKLGYKRAVVPAGEAAGPAVGATYAPQAQKSSLEVAAVAGIEQAMEALGL